MPLGRTLDRMVKRKRCASANLALADKAELFTAKLADALHNQALAPVQVRLLFSLVTGSVTLTYAFFLGGQSRRRSSRSFAPAASRQCHTKELAG